MKAMILAAGLGTRLRPLTADKPKALVELNGRPLLEWLILRLQKYGFNEIIINTHHFAEQIQAFIQKKNYVNLRIEISFEEKLLDTGGGLKKAAWFFNDGRPFLVHNVDVLTNLNLDDLLAFHIRENALATLAVRNRKTTRYFLFDQENRLCGWKDKARRQRKTIGRSNENLRPFSFMGIHVLSPHIFEQMQKNETFSIIETYLNLAQKGRIIKAFPADAYRWLDLGRPESLKQASEQFAFLLR